MGKWHSTTISSNHGVYCNRLVVRSLIVGLNMTEEQRSWEAVWERALARHSARIVEPVDPVVAVLQSLKSKFGRAWFMVTTAKEVAGVSRYRLDKLRELGFLQQEEGHRHVSFENGNSCIALRIGEDLAGIEHASLPAAQTKPPKYGKA